MPRDEKIRQAVEEALASIDLEEELLKFFLRRIAPYDTLEEYEKYGDAFIEMKFKDDK